MSERRVRIDELTEELANNLREFANIKKPNEIINNSLCLLNWAIEQTLEGKKIASYDSAKDEIQLFSMPILDRVEKNSKKKKLGNDSEKSKRRLIKEREEKVSASHVAKAALSF